MPLFVVLASLREFHEGFAWFVVIGNGLAGAWALAAHRVEPLQSRALWWFVGLAHLSMFVQVGTGVGMQAGQGIEAPQFHLFYGFVALIAIAIIYSYRHQMEQHRYLLYGFGSLFGMGLGIRAMILG